jgi:hypothetical protein
VDWLVVEDKQGKTGRNNMAKKQIAQGIGKLIKQGLRKAYQGKTAPLQAGSKLANRLAPNSKVAATLAAIASPAMLQEGPSKKAPVAKNPVKETTDPTRKAPTKRIQGNAANRGTFTARKRTGSRPGAGGGTTGSPFAFNLPGDDMASIPRNAPGKVKRMNAGGLAIKGLGKAFKNSKR